MAGEDMAGVAEAAGAAALPSQLIAAAPGGCARAAANMRCCSARQHACARWKNAAAACGRARVLKKSASRSQMLAAARGTCHAASSSCRTGCQLKGKAASLAAWQLMLLEAWAFCTGGCDALL